MSLILDALNRSERERSSSDAVPNLATEHYLDTTATGPGWRQHLPWLALVVALLVIGWLVWDRLGAGEPGQAQTPSAAIVPVVRGPAPTVSNPETQQPELTAAVRDPAPSQTPEPPSPAPAAATPKPAVAEPVVSEDVANLYQQGGRAGAMPEAQASAADTTAEAAMPEPVTDAPATAETVMAEAASEKDLDIVALVARAENELENAHLAEHPAPFLADLSQQKKDQIPTLMYVRHDYNSDSKVSAVTINGKSLRAGGNAGGGVKVVEVLPDSVVLSHQGTEFRLRALNSWVNL